MAPKNKQAGLDDIWEFRLKKNVIKYVFSKPDSGMEKRKRLCLIIHHELDRDEVPLNMLQKKPQSELREVRPTGCCALATCPDRQHLDSLQYSLLL